MTSKISFFNLCVENMKRRMWLLVLSSLTFFISMPLAMMIMLQNESSFQELTEKILMQKFSAFFGMGLNSVLAAGFAILCAVAGFSWLYSKKKVDLYHSIPVRREVLFAACYVNGILLYVLPYLVSCLICLIIAGQYMTITGGLLSMAAVTLGIHILFFLLFYNVMLVAVMLTGNMINCLITGGVIFIYALAVRTLLEAYLSYFMITYYERWSFVEGMRFTSPLLAMIFFVKRFVRSDHGMMAFVTGGSFVLYLLQCVILMVCAGVVALLLYRKRPSEAAGRSIAFDKILHLYRILLVIPLALGSGIFFSVLVTTGSEAIEMAWMCFGLIFGLVLSHGFIEVLFQMDIRGMFSYKRQLLGTGIVVFLIAFSIRGDWYGFNKSIPKQKNVESIAVYIPALEEGSLYLSEEDNYLSGLDEYIFKYMELTSDAAYELAKKGAEYTGKAWEENNRIRFVVKYNMKNGRDMYRQYWLSMDEAYPYMEKIYQSEEYKDVMLKRFQEYTINEICIGDIEYQSMDLNKKWISEFLDIYSREYKALTMEQAVESGAVAYMDFNCTNEDGRYVCRGRSIPIYGACEETIRFLEEHGAEEMLLLGNFDADRITSITIAIYDEELYREVTGDEDAVFSNYEISVTDKAEIELLAPYLRSYRSSSIFSPESVPEEGVDVFVNIKTLSEEYGFNAMLIKNSPWREIVIKHKDNRN